MRSKKRRWPLRLHSIHWRCVEHRISPLVAIRCRVIIVISIVAVIMTIVATKGSTNCEVVDVACVGGSSSSLKGTEKIKGIATRTDPRRVAMLSFFLV